MRHVPLAHVPTRSPGYLTICFAAACSTRQLLALTICSLAPREVPVLLVTTSHHWCLSPLATIDNNVWTSNDDNMWTQILINVWTTNENLMESLHNRHKTKMTHKQQVKIQIQVYLHPHRYGTRHSHSFLARALVTIARREHSCLALVTSSCQLLATRTRGHPSLLCVCV